jgi:hypothetical protein
LKRSAEVVRCHDPGGDVRRDGGAGNDTARESQPQRERQRA